MSIRHPAGALALALLSPFCALGASDAELAEIRNEIGALKSSYEARIQALEQRLKEAEARAPAQPAAPAAPAAVASAPPLPVPPLRRAP